METGTGHTAPYTLSFLGTRGQYPRIHTKGDRDRQNHPYTPSFLGTWGQEDSTLGYIHMEIGTGNTTPIHSHFWGRGDMGTVP